MFSRRQLAFAYLGAAALLLILSVSAVGASRNGPSSQRAVVVDGGLRWDGRTFTTALELRRHLEADNVRWDPFLRRHPEVVRAFQLRGLLWGRTTHYSAEGLARWLRARGVGYRVWAKRHPGAATLLLANRTAPVRATAGKPPSSRPDHKAPTAVEGLTASTAVDPLRVSLSWQASFDRVGVAGYRVTRDGNLVATVTALGYDDAAVAAGVTYIYSVVAFDAAGNESTPASISVTTPSPSTSGDSTPTSEPAPTPTTSTAPATAVGFGVSAGGSIEWYDDAKLKRELDGYQAIGAQWIRFDLKWSVVEGTKGSYNWGLYDRLVAKAHERGLKVLAMVGYTPAWAVVSGCSGDKCEPANVNDFANFAEKAVARYAPLGVKAYEVWNEPNLGCCFWKPKANPAKYAEMVKAAYSRMKAVDSSITVLAGATSPAVDDGTNVAPRTFLSAVYANGGKGAFDAWSHHPYYGPPYPEDPYDWSAWYQMCCANPSLRSIMVANGDGDKKIWATETGAKLGITCCGATTTEALQADLLKDAFAKWRSYPWAGVLTYYNYYGHDEFSLVRPDWSPRPAWYAYRDAPK